MYPYNSRPELSEIMPGVPPEFRRIRTTIFALIVFLAALRLPHEVTPSRFDDTKKPPFIDVNRQV